MLPCSSATPFEVAIPRFAAHNSAVLRPLGPQGRVRYSAFASGQLAGRRRTRFRCSESRGRRDQRCRRRGRVTWERSPGLPQTEGWQLGVRVRQNRAVPEPPPSVAALSIVLAALGWVTELFVGGSAATGDYLAGVSDLDLVALTDGPVDCARQEALRHVHVELDRGEAAGLNLGCVYVDRASLTDLDALHPTWTHGAMVIRSLSAIARAELVRYGYSVLGRPPQTLLPDVTEDDIRVAARRELTGYWATAAARPWWWLDRTMIDLGLTSMARGRHALLTGQLLTKTAAIDVADAPSWLIEQVRVRRLGGDERSPLLRSAWHGWRDARRTTADARQRKQPRLRKQH
jgi:hypothetical protein